MKGLKDGGLLYWKHFKWRERERKHLKDNALSKGIGGNY